MHMMFLDLLSESTCGIALWSWMYMCVRSENEGL